MVEFCPKSAASSGLISHKKLWKIVKYIILFAEGITFSAIFRINNI